MGRKHSKIDFVLETITLILDIYLNRKLLACKSSKIFDTKCVWHHSSVKYVLMCMTELSAFSLISKIVLWI